jgi:hypothetical protein
MTSLSLLTPAWELSEKLDALNVSRSFIASILYEAYDRDDQEQIEEFSAKLAEVDKEMNELTEKAL